ncbi:hypothetical protein KUTeg_016982 [Tegillarca granosa]|uniref:RING-type E3 ubiquitin transferase n=1 Tax=Tegillarca granosa TaxID=220873 RepID=A0ABQ9ER73_TEGGR|nr:hypothetical protein KUTeg_016982 [Tegillarca granosa]
MDIFLIEIMWIQVRSFDGKTTMQVDNLSKLTKIEDLRSRLIDTFNAPPDCQRLFYRGKQLEDGHTLFDYSVGLNDLVQIMVRQKIASPKKEPKPVTNGYNSSGEESVHSDKENEPPKTKDSEPSTSKDSEDVPVDDSESTYKVGDIVDARDTSVGAWFEAKIIKITKTIKEEKTSDSGNEDIKEDDKNVKTDETNNNSVDINQNNNTVDSMEVDGVNTDNSDNKDEICSKNSTNVYDDDDPEKLKCKDIRPRARKNLKLSDIKEGQKVMANYNVDDPDQRGFWYDCVITSKRDTRTIKELVATVFIGTCKIFQSFLMILGNGQNKPDCDHCKDNPRKKCKFCACCVCGGKNDPEKQILCDECDQAYHLQCVNPPLDKVPEEDEWYCPDCKVDDSEIVKAGEKMKESKKKSKMASATSTSSRDWGKGMACVGRQKVCSIVPPDHFGSIPGVEVGTLWKFRVQVSEAGVHRPHVAGIHGREDIGSFSIVLSGGYEDDNDEGDEFTYTGSGGRDLSGNKRTAEQSCDQQLTRMNRALAKNCNAPIDTKKGATAENWKDGKPVRVVRNCKGRKHSKYAPEEGNRYDGIYKVVKYWPEKGKSGFLVWRYLLRRDDPIPSPWSKQGKKRIEELGLTMQYPDGYLEAQAKKEEAATGTPGGKGKGSKRKRDEADSSPSGTPEKKQKKQKFKLDAEKQKLIKEDTQNSKLWEEAKELTSEGSQKFLQKLEELFTCICCQELVFKPVTTECNHNICKACLVRSFKAEIYNCPLCRADLGKDYDAKINKTLQELLRKFFPGYEAGR